ncbi:hypothetical protein BDN72DRAFT_439725 [Pluteus cervinus]|uniref:Uncharacterized protein n=1 Tax=Pluteus cervinus TaxID=181527 RepID=A0ACD3A765_9AGAR|nr:hypothetical protein BDN72DRAFT_439725 [Pluteus cervinus]
MICCSKPCCRLPSWHITLIIASYCLLTPLAAQLCNAPRSFFSKSFFLILLSGCAYICAVCGDGFVSTNQSSSARNCSRKAPLEVGSLVRTHRTFTS